jgi:RNA polymerase sigma-70 factor (ECF subfamily)
MDEQWQQAVVKGLREGKTEAWQALYEAYAEPVWRGVARLLGPCSADVADVVQETMMAAARSAATFDARRGSLWMWLWGIARRHVALHYRHQERQARLKDACAWLAAGNGRLLPWLTGHESSPPAELLAAEVALLVRAALTELSDEHERLLTARYMDGDTVLAIASREGSTETAVRSRLARARRAFRLAFGKRADPAPDPLTPAQSARPGES